MRRARGMTFVAALLAGGLALTACGGDDDNGGSTPSGGAGGGGNTAAGNLKVGLAYDIGGRGDKSFNDSAATGLEKAKKDLGLKSDNVRELSARPDETDADRAQRLELLAKAGFNPIIAVGFKYGAALNTVAAKYPNVKFAIIDGQLTDAKGANISNLLFAEEQGSFLVGAAAALKSTTGQLGFIGGCDVPLIHKFQAGFEAGAKAVKPTATIKVKYLSTPQSNPSCFGFNAPDAAKESAKGMYDGGADVVYHAAGGSGTGLFEAAKDANKLAIGVDSDQYQTAAANLQPVILTSMIKHVDVAVFNFIDEAASGSVKSGEQNFQLKDGGVEYSTSGGKLDDVKSKLDDYKKQIIDGKITGPTGA